MVIQKVDLFLTEVQVSHKILNDGITDLVDWLELHYGKQGIDWLYGLNGRFHFRRSADAMLFKLVWGGR